MLYADVIIRNGTPIQHVLGAIIKGRSVVFVKETIEVHIMQI